MNELDFVLEYLPINIKKTISIYLDNENNNIFSKNNINYAKYNCTEYNKLNDICELKTESQKAPNNTELVEEISESYDKYQERIKKSETKSAPKKQLEKAIEAIQNIDKMILISLNDEKIEEFTESLGQLEEEIKLIKNEVGKYD